MVDSPNVICTAVIRHGPGHQSRRSCTSTVEGHEVHSTYLQVAGHQVYWRGELGSTGPFDESPLNEDEHEDDLTRLAAIRAQLPSASREPEEIAASPFDLLLYDLRQTIRRRSEEWAATGRLGDTERVAAYVDVLEMIDFLANLDENARVEETDALQLGVYQAVGEGRWNAMPRDEYRRIVTLDDNSRFLVKIEKINGPVADDLCVNEHREPSGHRHFCVSPRGHETDHTCHCGRSWLRS